MEEIEKILDELDTAGVDRLLANNIRFPMDIGARKRIAAAVFRKAGIGTQPGLSFAVKFVLAAAAMALVAVCVFAAASGGVAAAISRLFNFVPGHAIVENNNSIQYYFVGPASAEKGGVTLSVSRSVATKDTIQVITALDYDQAAPGIFLPKSKVTLYVTKRSAADLSQPAVRSYEGRDRYGGGGTLATGKARLIQRFDFKVQPGDVDGNAVYRLEYADPVHSYSVEFRLTKVDSFESLEEIGATDAHNDISITAVPSLKDDILTVDLYPVNKTRYEFSFSIPDGQRHLGPPMRLETSNGAREYTLPEGPRFGPHTRFMFRVSPGDRNLVLRIPYLLVSNPFKPPWADEELQYVSLPLPVDGQKIPINRKVDFGDSVMTIVDAERQPGNVINMSLQVENRLPHKILFHAYLRSVNFWGTEKEDGGSGEWIFDENGLPAAVRYHLANSDSGTLRLSVQYPNYYLVGDYVLELDRYLQKAKSPAP